MQNKHISFNFKNVHMQYIKIYKNVNIIVKMLNIGLIICFFTTYF